MNGRAANAAVACWEGEVLAHVCVEVLASQGETGAARVVRVISHPGMSQAVKRMTRALRLSGLCGFDFILDSSDGSAHLIELNPRATQTCHLVSSDGEQLLVSLAAKLQGLHGVDSRRRPECGPIVLFPHGFACDPKDPYLQYAYSDLPRNSPELIKLGVEFGYKKNRFFTKAIHQAYEKIPFGRRQAALKEQFSELEQAPKDPPSPAPPLAPEMPEPPGAMSATALAAVQSPAKEKGQKHKLSLPSAMTYRWTGLRRTQRRAVGGQVRRRRWRHV